MGSEFGAGMWTGRILKPVRVRTELIKPTPSLYCFKNKFNKNCLSRVYSTEQMNEYHLKYEAEFCLYACRCILMYMPYNYPETIGRTNIKQDKINHHLGVSVIRGLVTPS